MIRACHLPSATGASAGAPFKLIILLTLALRLARSDNGGPIFTEPILNVTIPVGREAVLSCVVENLSTYKIAWLRVNTQTILTIANHVITKNHRISVTHSDHRAWYLHIRDVRESDAGDYMCQINTDPMISQIGYLEIVVPPDILDYPTSTDMVVREGSNVTLKCAATGTPTPNITWRREAGEQIVLGNGQEVISVEGSLLNITRVNRLHMGAYLCIASNGVPPTVSKRIMLIVHFPPMIWIQNQLVGAQEEEEMTLECLSEAFPKSINYWTRENDEIIANSDKYEPVLLDNAYKVHMKLTIRSVTQDDYGTYKCISKNSLGSTDGSIKLYHIPTPTTTTPKTTTTTTTTMTPILPVTRAEKKQRSRQKITPSSEPRVNEVTGSKTAAKKEDTRYRGKANDDATGTGKAGTVANTSRKNGNHNNNLEQRLDLRDKTAQSRSSATASANSMLINANVLRNATVTAIFMLFIFNRMLACT
ncbi:opioid-binding protein/cell adhesion molecule homolog isoform X2 [Phymastichus coffea]|uniref:opioid-binding protein/cell adhesion molecule homolog isoform X2 n=1 Tax=Phymastichus coffea TaxID=108790 RepID=UPI00273B51A6|nr:opioid-binding protein/cell adhesion molecule homolog isoform X2 [Phymastichus coffea]